MAQITRSIKINASLSKVFDYVTNPGNWTKYVTSLVDIRNVSSDVPETGTTFEWTYRMLGINNDGIGKIGDFEKNSGDACDSLSFFLMFYDKEIQHSEIYNLNRKRRVEICRII